MKSLLGYTNVLTARPGEEIEFKVSSELQGDYDAQLVRLVNGDSQSELANFKEEEICASVNRKYPGRHQPINPGSCLIVEDCAALDSLDNFSISIRFLATQLGPEQHLIGRWNHQSGCGWALFINIEGELGFVSATEDSRLQVSLDRPVRINEWAQASVRIDRIKKRIQLDCAQIPLTPIHALGLAGDQSVTKEFNQPVFVDAAPLVMAAAFNGWDKQHRIIPARCFNGRLEAPVVYRAALSDEQLRVVSEGGRPDELAELLLADWDFSRGIGTTDIFDISAMGLHGYTFNLPVRAVRGANWDGTEMNWTRAPQQYGAIHFHDDDLYDCGWETDFNYIVAPDLRSGIYAMRLTQDEHEEYIPFFVAAPKNDPQAKLAFIVPTYTYMAYANNHIMDLGRKKMGLAEDVPVPLMGTPGEVDYDQIIRDNSCVGRSTYDLHSDASPVHYSSWLRPVLNMRPKTWLWTLCADLLFTDWMEAKQIDYDIITDDLLQKEGVDLLKNYRVVMSGNHPEYPTTEQLDAIETYLEKGGRFMYMGGNGYYWRSAVHKTLPGVIEVRRGRIGTLAWKSEVGELFMEFSGEQGGIWREIGRPPQRLFGVGFIAQGAGAAPYRIKEGVRESRAAFILEGVDNDIIGDYGVFGAAAGQEIDQASAVHGTPSHAIVLASSENHGEAMLHVIEESGANTPPELTRSLVFADIVFFETPNGGAMFTVGSMNWCGSLGHNNYENDVSTITHNVISRFSDSAPFQLPDA